VHKISGVLNIRWRDYFHF